ncbi:NADH dehydrogenase [ubiquinone] 1 alpha subcomplex subunit 6 [Selaginella moellendorffii]|nr:NADH dehydrogenase [ubiquinone] 1 alpha subcomplex subunit 6 [Selaginella moellendorffii]|eukprot:XP_002961939.2 NADH dehydrogenase [ubiquinone] 1 alpha subcomplex subunit 6 [Selaginella moellendorffii]
MTRYLSMRGYDRLMSFKSLVQSGSSKDLPEAQERVLELYRRSVRSVPFIMECFNMEGVATPAQLRSRIMKEFRKKTDITNPRALDLLVVKGLEELMMFLTQTKQRHHLIAQYVQEESFDPRKLGIIDRGESEFLKKFLEGNA